MNGMNRNVMSGCGVISYKMYGLSCSLLNRLCLCVLVFCLFCLINWSVSVSDSSVCLSGLGVMRILMVRIISSTVTVSEIALSIY